MLDEPSLGLAPVVVKAIFEDLGRINARGLTILLVEQNVLAIAPARPPGLRAREWPGDALRARAGAARQRPHQAGLPGALRRKNRYNSLPGGPRIGCASAHRVFVVPFLLLAIPLGILAGLGFIAAHRQLERTRDAAVARTVDAVNALVADYQESLRRETILLARDPAVVEGTAKGDWAILARGASPACWPSRATGSPTSSRSVTRAARPSCRCRRARRRASPVRRRRPSRS